jgi:hypothetical protein
MPTKNWKDMSGLQRVGVIAGGVVQFGLLTAALVDIARRPAGQIRGRKVLWVGLSFINYAGPICYFAFGRKRPQTEVIMT